MFCGCFFAFVVSIQVMDDENESLKEMLGRGGSNLAGLQKVTSAVVHIVGIC